MAREGRKEGVWEEGRPQSRKRSRGLWGPMGYCCHGDSRVDELKRRKLQQKTGLLRIKVIKGLWSLVMTKSMSAGQAEYKISEEFQK